MCVYTFVVSDPSMGDLPPLGFSDRLPGVPTSEASRTGGRTGSRASVQVGVAEQLVDALPEADGRSFGRRPVLDLRCCCHPCGHPHWAMRADSRGGIPAHNLCGGCVALMWSPSIAWCQRISPDAIR